MKLALINSLTIIHCLCIFYRYPRDRADPQAFPKTDSEHRAFFHRKESVLRQSHELPGVNSGLKEKDSSVPSKTQDLPGRPHH